jgi:hydroxyethylthiazole kinase
MLISPPFLPAQIDGETDSAWLDRAMREVEDGAYPVGHNLCWHGAVHLQVPMENGQPLPVRAIADGIVRFRRDATPHDDNPEHVLAYDGGWTSDGVVVIEHNTDIGAAANDDAVVAVRYFSIYQHLTDIPAAIATGSTVYRKAELGQAGRIAGQPDRIHFEIVCDDANLGRLTGRSEGTLPVDRNGRSDVVFGEIYIRLPAGTPVYVVPEGRRLADDRAAAHTLATGAHPGNPQPLAASETTAADYCIGLRYGMGEGALANRGDLTVTTYSPDGTVCGERREGGAEYQIYTRANAISQACPDGNRPAPSAVYELLRFGRVINRHETLTPEDVPHWREIIVPAVAGGTRNGWVNLNNRTDGQRVTVFSDADFPDWRGWRIFDDDISPEDSRCDSEAIKQLLDMNDDDNVTPEERQTRMNDAAVRLKLRKAICTIPSEWDAAALDARWSWLQQSTEENPTPLTGENYDRFIEFARALSFAVPEAATANRRFHPRGFIEAFRRCGWLSTRELSATFPRYMFYTNANPSTAITQANAIYNLTRQVAMARITQHAVHLNHCMRKYIGHDKKRIALFLAQVLLETAQWRTHQTYGRLREWGLGAYNPQNPNTQYYTSFFGRGIMQLTWAGNYKKYGEYGEIPNHQGAYVERRDLPSPRITATSLHYLAEPTENPLPLPNFQWSPRFDPDIISENAHYACDSGGFFWVSKTFLGTMNINRVSDRNYSAANVKDINRYVNGGGNGRFERQSYSAYMLRYLTDDTAMAATMTIAWPYGSNNVNEQVIANMEQPQ